MQNWSQKFVSVFFSLCIFVRLGDILPQGHFAPLTKCPKDILSQDILPQIAQPLEGGHIAPTVELWWTFCPKTFCPTFERL